jgi:superfamily II DNA or RNA helicase
MLILSFDQGTLLLEGLEKGAEEQPPGFVWDERVSAWRAEGAKYRESVLWLRRRMILYTDRARQYDPQTPFLQPRRVLTLDHYQEQAVEAWRRAGQRGFVVLPTGAGKTIVGLRAIDLMSRPTLVVAPTLVLMNQWRSRLRRVYGAKIGIIGQGEYDLQKLTVITYHSARRRIGEIGGCFGLLIFDEAHHLAAPEWAEIARLAIAPFRLGLTATYDARQSALLETLVGSLAYWKPIRDLIGERLAPYEVVRLNVELSPEERCAYEHEEAVYSMYWQGKPPVQNEKRLAVLLKEQGRDLRARSALDAWRLMRRIVACSEAKLDLLEELFRRHAPDQTVVFTATREMVYKISQTFFIPAITHDTPAPERNSILDRFDRGEYKAVVASKVLNEGVDLPQAAVAIVLGGTGSAREHTQRLGRVLRKAENKLAILYEICVRGTIEASISQRRRRTEAFAGRGKSITQI